MKNIFIGLAVVAMASSALADATIEFKSRNIPKADGSGFYDVPIWADNNGPGLGTVGAGSLAGGVMVALYFNGVQLYTPVSAPVRTALRFASSQQFFSTSSFLAVVPGVAPGTSQLLEVRAWNGANPELATIGARWAFMSQPLGGTDEFGNTFPIPSMTGWGPESGVGLELVVPEPTTLTLAALGACALLISPNRRRYLLK